MAESDVLCEDDVRESRGDSEAHFYPEIPNSWLWEGQPRPPDKQREAAAWQGPGWGCIVVNGHDARVRKETLHAECLHRTPPGGAPPHPGQVPGSRDTPGQHLPLALGRVPELRDPLLAPCWAQGKVALCKHGHSRRKPGPSFEVEPHPPIPTPCFIQPLCSVKGNIS